MSWRVAAGSGHFAAPARRQVIAQLARLDGRSLLPTNFANMLPEANVVGRPGESGRKLSVGATSLGPCWMGDEAEVVGVHVG